MLGSKFVHQHLELGFLIFAHVTQILFRSGLIHLLFLELGHLLSGGVLTWLALVEEELAWGCMAEDSELGNTHPGRPSLSQLPGII